MENTVIDFRTLRDKAITRYANDNNDTYMVYANISGQSAWCFNTTVTPTTSTTTGDIDTTAAVYYWPGVQDVYFYSYACSKQSDFLTSYVKINAGALRNHVINIE